MYQPEGYIKPGQEIMVYKLKKALYGIKQALRASYAKLDSYLIENGFHQCESDHSLCVKGNLGSISIVVGYVDDMLITRDDKNSIAFIKDKFEKVFEMTDLGMLYYYLGIEVKQNNSSITLLFCI